MAAHFLIAYIHANLVVCIWSAFCAYFNWKLIINLKLTNKCDCSRCCVATPGATSRFSPQASFWSAHKNKCPVKVQLCLEVWCVVRPCLKASVNSCSERPHTEQPWRAKWNNHLNMDGTAQTFQTLSCEAFIVLHVVSPSKLLIYWIFSCLVYEISK